MFQDLTTNLSDVFHHPGRAFPDLVVVVLIATGVLIVCHLLLALVGGRAPKPRQRFGWWEKLLYLGALVSVTVLAVTSFYTVIRFHGMHGWWLFFHMFGAGALTGVLPLLAITWCGANRFGRMTAEQAQQPVWPRFFWIPKFLFWVFLLAGFVVVMSMLVSMLPIFGSDGLNRLADLHRYAGLLAVVALLLHFYCVLLQRAQLR